MDGWSNSLDEGAGDDVVGKWKRRACSLVHGSADFREIESIHHSIFRFAPRHSGKTSKSIDRLATPTRVLVGHLLKMSNRRTHDSNDSIGFALHENAMKYRCYILLKAQVFYVSEHTYIKRHLQSGSVILSLCFSA